MKLKNRNFFPFGRRPGGSETTLAHLINNIRSDARMSKRRKDELIDQIENLAGHIIDDVYTGINLNYDSAYYSGIENMRWEFKDDRPGVVMRTMFYETLRRLRMNLHLADQKTVEEVRLRLVEVSERLNPR